MVEVRKKEDEAFDSLLRRFNRKIQQSGIVSRARKTRYFERAKSRNLRRKSAQHKATLRELRDDLKRLGKVIPRRLSAIMHKPKSK